MIQFWIRKEASLAFSWFTHDPLSFDPKVRRDFYIEMDKYERKERPKTTVGRLMTGTSRKSDWTDEKIQADEMKAEDFTFPLWVRAKMVSSPLSVLRSHRAMSGTDIGDAATR
eukprot:2485442-Rhodomonas_salina.1